MPRSRGKQSDFDALEMLQLQNMEFVLLKLGSKLRSSLILVASIFALSYVTGKYGLFKDLLEEFKTILSINSFANAVNFDQSIDVNSRFQYQKMKTQIQKIKNTIKRNITYVEQLKSKPAGSGRQQALLRRKKSKNIGVNNNNFDAKVYDFVDIWLRTMTVS